MGLDQWVYAGKGEYDTSEEIFYWRKHSDLHGWFEDRFDKGLNCINVEIDMPTLQSLKEDYSKGLKPASGFFWGKSDWYHHEKTEEFFSIAERYLKDGYKLWYGASY